jgi:hypothetical protein
MDEMIKKNNGQYNTYEELLVKRDQLTKEAGSIYTSYMKEFGELLLENFELKIECIKKKKMIAYCQAALNHGDVIDVNDMNAQIDKSMALYNMQLKEMMSDKNNADKSTTSPQYKIDRAKRIYRRLVKSIHPDINPLTSENDELRELWERIVIAYRCNDDDELNNLEVLVRKVLKENGETVATPIIDNLDERIANLETEINDIITTEPYTHLDLLSSPEKVQLKKHELNKEIEEYKKYSQELTKILENILSEGGATLTWIQI